MHLKYYIDKYKDFFGVILIITVITLPGLFLYYALEQDEKISREREAREAKTEQGLTESRDSLVAFMSVIIEANQALVNDPKSCRWLLLTEIKQPYYAVRHGDGWTSLKLEKPFNDVVYIWIPTDNETWTKSSRGSDLTKCRPLFIGSKAYNGDLKKIHMRVIDKQDRGF